MSSASTSPTSVAGLVKTVRGLFFFGSLVKNPDKLDSVFEMRDSMTSPEIVIPVVEALSAKSPRAAAAFRDRPRLGKIDVAALAQLPVHTLGGTYGRFLQKNALNPDAIPTLQADADWEYLSAHLYETHDLWHVLTGFGVDVAGEGGLQGFYAAQVPGGLASALLSAILLNNAMLNDPEETERRMSAITEGWLMGKRAQTLFGFRFADRFGDSLADIQRELGIIPVGGAEISREQALRGIAALGLRGRASSPRGALRWIREGVSLSHSRRDRPLARHRTGRSPPSAERPTMLYAIRHPAAVAASLLALLGSVALQACAAPPPQTAPPQPSAPAPSRTADTATLRKCCAALSATADTLTPPKAMYAGAAADRCKKDVDTVQTELDQDHLIATLRGELRGTPMPKECD